MQMSAAPRVSVIMPAFNCRAYISEALQSVFSQGIEAIEVIVVDDGSTDNTGDIAAAFDPRVRVIKGKNLGPAGARNLAVANSTGAFLAFLDADDVWLPGKLLAQMQLLENVPEAKIVYAGHIFWHADADDHFPPPETYEWVSKSGLNPVGSGWIYPEMLLDSQIHIITAVCHRSVFDLVGGFDGTFGKGSDYDFWIRASRHFQIYKLARDGALYRMNPDGITMRLSDVCSGYEILNRAILTYGYAGPDGRAGDRARIHNRMAQICFNHGYMHFWKGSPNVAAVFFRKAIRLGRRDLKTWCYWAVSMLKNMMQRQTTKLAG
jgi:glycosyltransferase involved in cell wall biosynthesis